MHAYLTHCTAGDGSLANELLPRTKGHGMGYGFVSLSFGIAFFFSILCFGYISAYMVGPLPAADGKCVSRRQLVFLILIAHFMLSARPQVASTLRQWRSIPCALVHCRTLHCCWLCGS